MDRREELLREINNDPVLVPLVDEMVYLEEQLSYLRTLPNIRVCPTDPAKQKETPSSKLYKSLLQQYNIVVRTIAKATGRGEEAEESPLRRWANEHMDRG